MNVIAVSNHTDVLENDFYQAGTDRINEAIGFYNSNIGRLGELPLIQRGHFNTLTILHGITEQLLFPTVGFSASLDPEVTFYTLVDTPMNLLFKMREIGLFLIVRRWHLCEYIRRNADVQTLALLQSEDINSLEDQEKIKLVGAIADGFSAFSGASYAGNVVSSAIEKCSHETAFDIYLGNSVITIDRFSGDEADIGSKVNLIIRPVKNLALDLWRFSTVIQVYDEKMLGMHQVLPPLEDYIDESSDEDE